MHSSDNIKHHMQTKKQTSQMESSSGAKNKRIRVINGLLHAISWAKYSETTMFQ